MLRASGGAKILYIYGAPQPLRLRPPSALRFMLSALSLRRMAAALRRPPDSRLGSLRCSELQARELEIRSDVPSCRDLPALEIVEALELGVEIGFGGEIVGHTCGLLVIGLGLG